MQTAMEELTDDFSQAELETVLRFIIGANQFAGDVLDEVAVKEIKNREINMPLNSAGRLHRPSRTLLNMG